MTTKQFIEKDVSNTIVEIATFVPEEDWETVFKLLLEMNEESFITGYLTATRVGKNYHKLN